MTTLLPCWKTLDTVHWLSEGASALGAEADLYSIARAAVEDLGEEG